MRAAKALLAVASGTAIVSRRWQIRVPHRVFIPAGCVAFVVVLLPFAERMAIEPFVTHEQRGRQAIRDFGQPDWQISPNGTSSFQVAPCIVTQGVCDRNAAHIDWITVVHGLRTTP